MGKKEKKEYFIDFMNNYPVLSKIVIVIVSVGFIKWIAEPIVKRILF